MLQNKNNKAIVRLFIVGMAFLLLSCNQETDLVVDKEFKTHALPVLEVVNKELPVYYTTIGSVISDNRIHITSRITGYIREIIVREGEPVNKGALLVSLESSAVEGAIEQAAAVVGKADSALKDAEIDVERYESLFKKGSVPENALRKIRLQRDVSRDNLCAVQAAHETAKSQRQYIQIKSPVDGVVVKRQKRAGDLAVPGFPIISIESGEALLFKSFVPESQIQKVVQGAHVTVAIDALGKTLNGQILRIIPSGDSVTRSYEIKVSLNDSTGLLPGMFGRVRFRIGTEKAPVIARTAVVERGGLRGVFVVDAERRAHFRWLRFGREWPDCLQVQTGLSQGERIVANNVSLIHDGDLIKTGERNE